MSDPPTPKPDEAPLGAYAGLFAISAATLLLEIGLTRVLSYTIWYHFAFVVISVALLGFGASGSVIALSTRLRGGDPRRVLGLLSATGAMGTALTSGVVTHVGLDPFALGTDFGELAVLGFYFLVVAIPFFCTGACVATALSRYPRRASALYFADLLGSSIGCLAVVSAIAWLGPKQLLAACVVLYGLAAFLFAGGARARVPLGLVLGALLLAEMNAFSGDFIITPTKLGHKYAQSGGRIVDSRWSAVFRTDLYDFGDTMTLADDPSLTIYGAPAGGVGRTYAGGFPSYRFITHDGDASAVMVASDGSEKQAELYRHHLLGIPYRFRPNAKVFLGGVGGGVDVLSAVANGAESIHGVELDSNTVRLICDAYADYNSRVCHRPGVHIEAGDARSVIRRSDAKYDIVNFTGVDTITAAASGAYMLSEGYLYTVEAFSDYMDHLRPGGVVSIITGDIGGGWGLPRMVPRFSSVAAAALERRGVEKPGDHVAILGTSLPDGYGLSHEVMLTKVEPFTDEEVRMLASLAEQEGFAIWHLPGRQTDTIASKILRSEPESREALLEPVHLDYSAVTDDRPFFMHFYKWRSLTSNVRFDYRYLEATGNVVLLVALGFGVIASIAFIVVPAVWHARRRAAVRIPAREVFYFSAIGLGFMLVEIAVVQQLALFLGYPTYSLTVTLFSILGSAALGSLWSRRLPMAPRTTWMLFGALILLTALHLSVGESARQAFLHWPLGLRALTAAVMVAPVGAVLGVFLPLGVRRLSATAPGAIPLAWAANGTFSVIGTTLATMLATVTGFTGVFLLALSLYLVAAIAAHVSAVAPST